MKRNDKRFTFKFLGILMQTEDFTPHELRKTLWTVAAIVGGFI